MPVQLVDAQPAAIRKRGFLFDTVTISAFSVLARLAGAAKAVVIAGVFGSGAALDSYLVAFLLPSVLADIFCGALVPVTVPRLIQLEHRASRASMIAFYSRVLSRSLYFSLLGTAVLALGIALAVARGWRTIGILTLLMLPVIPCNAVANVWRAALNSRRKFAIPAFTVVMTPAAIMLCISLAGHLVPRGRGVWMLAAGTTLGAVAELAVLGAAVRAAGFPVAPSSSFRKRDQQHHTEGFRMDRFRKEYGYLAATAAAGSGTVFIGQAMAASLGAGSVSVLNYGTRLAGVLMALGPAALSVAVLPRFSAMVAEQDWVTLKRFLKRLLFGSVASGGIAAVALISFSIPIVRLTLQRGAFTAADTNAVAAVQAWSLLQMPFVVGISILMRVFSALKATRVLLPVSGAALAVNLGLNYVFMRRYGVSGISLASSIAQGFQCAALAWLVLGPGGARFLRDRPWAVGPAMLPPVCGVAESEIGGKIACPTGFSAEL